MTGDGLEIRAPHPHEREAILRLLAASLGREDDPRFEQLFAWKHEENVFGPSPAWVAVDGDRIAGYRALMRWRWVRDGQTLHAVRAVDTATHPDYQGRGIFTRLTLHGIEVLRGEGLDFVFNTPNSQSRPGYLKMGWQVVGRIPIAVRPRRVRSLLRIVQARVPADRWTAPSVTGDPAAAVLEDGAAVERLLASQPPVPGLATDRSLAYLRWRYGTPLLSYRAVVAARGLDDGIAIFRVRERGPAREAVLDEVLVPGGDRRAQRTLVRRLARSIDADYLLRVQRARASSDGFFALPGQGPVFTWRDVCERRMPSLDEWNLTMGDVELF